MSPDLPLRLAAFAALGRIAQRHGGVAPRTELERGFEFEGERIRLFDPRRGIWRPRQLGETGAALTIVTAPPHPRRDRPYDDQIASDAGFFLYRYEGTDPDHWANRAVRRAMEAGLPLIYLYGLAPGTYMPLWPCYVVGDEPAALAFRVVAAAEEGIPRRPDPADIEIARRYTATLVKRRLHQGRFRELVVAAYRERCAVCRLRHPELLDAAHILEDRDERGRPEVPNGLALCKIHHGAFDTHILGVDPDYRIHIRRDVLEEEDGPMLEHGLQAMDRTLIHVPGAERLRPNRDYLAARFERFRAA